MITNKLKEYVRKESLLISLLLLFISLLTIYREEFIIELPKLIDLNTIIIIFIFIILSRSFEESGAFQNVATYIVRKFSKNPRKVLILLIIVISLASMLIMNDCAVIMFTPLSLYIADILEIDRSIIVTGVAAAANIGSTLTPFGNPQNIIIWRSSRITILKFCEITTPLVATLLLGLLAILSLYTKNLSNLQIKLYKQNVKINRRLLVTCVLLLIVDIVLIEVNKILIALVVTVILTAIMNWRVFKRLDYTLILVFILMFADFGKLSEIMSKCGFFATALNSPLLTYLMSIAISQVISNVPATILFIHYVHSSSILRALIYGVNIGGLGTIIGSLANFIAVRLSRASINSYHRYALPIFVFSILVGAIFTLLRLI
ncbi:MAG: hypothetical protein GXO26_05655 [Crenarchaeota archaeon]|nr:hypothetical protein [Thermoproteota archaeon]